MKKPRRKNAGAPRVRFPDDEKRLPWLATLLDAYALADAGIAAAVRQAAKRRKAALACGPGCDACCRQSDIPLYPHELVGIYWYAAEKLEPRHREIVKGQLARHAPGAPCPFLADRTCSLHPVRPLACRQFNVFGAPCAEGEDPYYSRREDVLEPLPENQVRVFAAVVPLYNLAKDTERAAAIRLIRGQIMNLPDFDWKRVTAIMERAEAGRPR